MPKQIKVVLRRNKNKKMSQQTKNKKSQVTILGKVFRELGGFGGGAFGSMVGHPQAGGAIGRQLGATLSKWLGAGDYTVAHNTILKSTQGIPSMHQTDEGVTIRHREYIGPVYGAQNFTVQSNFVLNPGMSATFPWLSGIATKFQEYRVNGAVYHYIPSSGSAVSSTNPALGTVMMSTSYRATAPPPTDRIQMLNQYWSSESVPSEAFVHPLECAKFSSPTDVLFTRGTVLPTTDNAMMYDFGITSIATGGQQSTGNALGDLWLTYEVEFLKPQVNSNVDFGGLFAMAKSTTTPDYTNIFTTMSLSPVNSLALTFGTNSFTIPAFSPGTYEGILFWNGATISPTTSVGYTYTNCSSSAVFASGVTAASTASTTTACVVFAFRVTDPTLPATIAFTFGSTTGTISSSNLAITRRSDALF